MTEKLRGWNGFKIYSCMNYTLKFYNFPKNIHRYLWRIDMGINSWIPLLFRVLNGVGDHRALYHVPNNFTFTLCWSFRWKKNSATKTQQFSLLILGDSRKKLDFQIFGLWAFWKNTASWAEPSFLIKSSSQKRSFPSWA